MLDYSKLSNEALADQIGKLDALAKGCNKRLSEAKAEFKARSIDAATGNRYTVTNKASVRWSMDTAKIKAEMPEQWVDDYSKHTIVQTVLIRTNEGQIAA